MVVIDLIKISKDIKIIPLIETPLAINNLDKIAKNEKVIGLSFGAADFSSMIGSEMSWDAMLYARSKIILECSINNLISIDSPFMNIANMDAFENEVKKIKHKISKLNIDDEKIILEGVTDCFFHVYGERKDVNPLVVEYEGETWEDYPDPEYNDSAFAR